MNRLTIPAFVLSGFVLGLAVAWLVHGLHAAPSLQPLLAERDKLQADSLVAAPHRLCYHCIGSGKNYKIIPLFTANCP